MNLILNQLRKDLQRLRVPLALWIVFLASVALPYFDLLSFAGLDDFSWRIYLIYSGFGYFAFCALITASAILEDPVVDTEAFWISRPPRAGTLLAGKACFVAVTVLGPTLLLLTVIFGYHGLWRSLMPAAIEICSTAMLLVSLIAACACLKKDAIQFMAVLLVLLLVTVGLQIVTVVYTDFERPFFDRIGPSSQESKLTTGETETAHIASLLAGVALLSLAVVNQYRTRKTWRSWALLLAAYVASFAVYRYWNIGLIGPSLERGIPAYQLSVKPFVFGIWSDQEPLDAGFRKRWQEYLSRRSHLDVEAMVELQDLPPSYDWKSRITRGETVISGKSEHLSDAWWFRTGSFRHGLPERGLAEVLGADIALLNVTRKSTEWSTIERSSAYSVPILNIKLEDRPPRKPEVVSVKADLAILLYRYEIMLEMPFAEERMEHNGFGLEIERIDHEDGGLSVWVNEYYPSSKLDPKSHHWRGNPYDGWGSGRAPPTRAYVVMNRNRGEAFAKLIRNPKKSSLRGFTVQKGRFATILPKGVDEAWLREATLVVADKLLVGVQEHTIEIEPFEIPAMPNP